MGFGEGERKPFSRRVPFPFPDSSRFLYFPYSSGFNVGSLYILNWKYSLGVLVPSTNSVTRCLTARLRSARCSLRTASFFSQEAMCSGVTSRRRAVSSMCQSRKFRRCCARTRARSVSGEAEA